MIASQQTEQKRPRVLVAGDAMLDIDVYLETVRPKGPEGVPVLKEVSFSNRPGGAAAVARMVNGLGADPLLMSRCTPAFEDLLYALTPAPMHTTCIQWRQPEKERRFADGVQVHRIDRECIEPVSASDIDLTLEWASPFVPDAILVADYGKGMVTREVMARLLERYPGVPILVDPARGADWTMYRGAAAIVPNLEEWRRDGKDIGRTIRIQKHGPEGIGVYLGGQYLSTSDIRFDGHEINCIDVCGAGDQVLATLGVMLAEGHDWISAARLANLAAALKCERVGATPVPRKELEDAAARLGIPVSASREMAAR